MKKYITLLFIVFQLSTFGQDSISSHTIQSETQTAGTLELEFSQFQAEMAAYSSLEKIRNGHIMNPFWGINTLGTKYPFESYLGKDKSCEGYELKWIQEKASYSSNLIKGETQALCGFSGTIIPGSSQLTNSEKNKSKPKQYSHVGTVQIGSKYVVLNFVQSYPIVQMPSQLTYYFENPTVELTQQDELLLKDSSFNLFSTIWYFLPALNESLSNLSDPKLLINDSLQHVQESIKMAKKMSLNDGTETVLADSNQLYTCIYRIQQFFDHDEPISPIFDAEKSSNVSTLRGYKIQKVDLNLSPKEFNAEGYYLSNYQLNEQQKGVYFYGKKYALFYEFNMQYQQAGNYTIENICLCEKLGQD
ncbi:MAG: hypothetical protein MI810_18725 [Flavobacteriales bacterium]|nr:hypothetical protein [Flavobacteriales bacterium]